VDLSSAFRGPQKGYNVSVMKRQIHLYYTCSQDHWHLSVV